MVCSREWLFLKSSLITASCILDFILVYLVHLFRRIFYSPLSCTFLLIKFIFLYKRDTNLISIKQKQTFSQAFTDERIPCLIRYHHFITTVDNQLAWKQLSIRDHKLLEGQNCQRSDGLMGERFAPLLQSPNMFMTPCPWDKMELLRSAQEQVVLYQNQTIFHIIKTNQLAGGEKGSRTIGQ